MKFKVNHYNPVRMQGVVDQALQGWVDIVADSASEAAEDYLRDWWEADPSDFGMNGRKVWVRAEDGSVTRFDVEVDWEPAFTAGLGERVEIDGGSDEIQS